MSIGSLIKKYIHREASASKERYEFTDDDREKSSIKRLESEIRKQRIQFLKEKLQRMKDLQEEQMLEEQVRDLESDFYGDEEEDDTEEGNINPADVLSNPDALLMQLFGQILNAPRNSQGYAPQPQASGQLSSNKATLTDEQLREIKAKIPASYLKKAKAMSDEQLVEFAKLYKPEVLTDYDEDTISRALKILRE